MRYTIIAIALCLLMLTVSIPVVEADVFKIGDPIGQSDTMYGGENATYFDSGCWLLAPPFCIEDLPALLDGNESTGLNRNYGPGHDGLGLYLYFPYPYHVDNITMKPYFGGNATSYRLYVYFGQELFACNDMNTNQMTFQVNGKVNGLLLVMLNGGTNQFNFNDIIINYTAMPGTANESLQAINILQNQVKVLQGQMDNLTARVSLLEWYFADIEACLQTINQTINSLNITLGNLNQTLQYILENLTGIYSMYEEMYVTIGDLEEEVKDMNATVQGEFAEVESDLVALGNSLEQAQTSIGNLETNTSVLPQVLVDIDNIIASITILDQDLTQLAGLIPDAYDENGMESRIFTLEGENTALQAEVGNLTAQLADSDAQLGAVTGEVNALNSELDSQGETIEQLRSDIDNQSQAGNGADTTQKETVVEKDPDNTLSMVAIMIGVLGVTLAVIGAMMVVSVRRKLGAMEETNEQRPGELSPEATDSGASDMEP